MAPGGCAGPAKPRDGPLGGGGGAGDPDSFCCHLINCETYASAEPAPPPAHYYWAAMAPPRQHTSAVGARGAWGHFHSSGAGAAHAAVARPRGHSPFRLCASPPQLARSPAAAAAGADHTLPSPRPDGSQGGRRGAGQGLWRRLPRAATASAPADAGVSRLQPVSLSILTRTIVITQAKYLSL